MGRRVRWFFATLAALVVLGWLVGLPLVMVHGYEWYGSTLGAFAAVWGSTFGAALACLALGATVTLLARADEREERERE